MIGVCIVTYNEQKYIAQCIESALAQKCQEPYRVYIGEDCSTDNTYSICKKYADEYDNVVLVHRDTNMGLVRNTIELLRQMQADGCDYIAMLDGDDYWIDDYKLEKQVSFLMKNPDYGFVHTNIHLLFDDKWFKINKRTNVQSGYLFDTSDCPVVVVANCTAFFRTELLNCLDLEDFIRFDVKSVDWPMYNIFMMFTKFQFLDDFTAVWRRGHTSVSNANDVRRQIEYSEHADNSWLLMGKYSPEKWPDDNYEDTQKYHDYNAFEISFKMKDYETCKKYSQSPFFKTRGIVDKIRALSVKTKITFLVVSELFRINRVTRKYINHIEYLLKYKNNYLKSDLNRK